LDVLGYGIPFLDVSQGIELLPVQIEPVSVPAECPGDVKMFEGFLSITQTSMGDGKLFKKHR
jgi:hypothetical protein